MGLVLIKCHRYRSQRFFFDVPFVALGFQSARFVRQRRILGGTLPCSKVNVIGTSRQKRMSREVLPC